jgi:hypothetical protein
MAGMKCEYREHQRVGPGGLYCPCCNPYNVHPRKMKHLVRRKVRRITKSETRKALDAE